MAHAARLNLRMQKEVKLLLSDPPPGASFPFLSDDLSSLQVQIEGPEGSVYAKGVFDLKIQIPERYPFHPPIVNFATPIYHPNIDTGGRICLDILNLPPKGAWQPSLNISTVITSIGLLLSEPNPDDGLMCDASRECKYNRQAFDQKAKAMTEKYAKPVANGQNTSSHSMPSDFRILTEAGGSNTGQKKDVSDFVVAPAKPHGISKKLSLESSCLTSKMEKNREEGENLLLRSENLMAAEASSKESNCIVNDGHRWKNQYGTGRKLSLGSSAHIHKKHDHEMGNIESKSSVSLCNAQATFAANCWGLSPEQLDDDQADFDQHVCETASRIETICPENQGQVSERTPLESHDKCETGTCEKAAITIGDLSTSESSKNVATRARPDRLKVINGELQSPKNSVVGAGTNDAPDLMVNKMNVSRKKLSLGLKGTMQRPEKCDKENSVPVSVFSTAKKVGTGRKVSRAPLTALQGSNDNNSQHLPADAPKKHRLDHHHTAKAARVDEQGRAEPSAAESELAVVLDSEDSEEEDGRSARSTALLLRKRAAKRKAQSVQTL